MKKINLIFSLVLLLNCIINAQQKDMIVGGYVPSWKDCSAVDYSKYTHLFFSFLKPNADGSFIPFTPEVQQYFEVFKLQTKGKQRFISLGGGGDETMAAMAVKDSARNKFADSCLQFCKDNELQGADMDWEGIRDNINANNFEALMKVMSEKFHANGLLLVATVGYGWGGEYYTAHALKYADWIQLMVYDQTGAWAESPYGNHASFQHVLDAVSFWKRKGYTKSSQIVIGLPYYGYKFNSGAGGLATQLSYSAIATNFPFLTADINEYNLIVFNGPGLIKQKTEYVKSKGFKGVMVWEVTQDLPAADDRSLLKAIDACVK
jgi:chitinase